MAPSTSSSLHSLPLFLALLFLPLIFASSDRILDISRHTSTCPSTFPDISYETATFLRYLPVPTRFGRHRTDRP